LFFGLSGGFGVKIKSLGILASLRAVGIAAVLAMTSSLAHATLFDFSYTFNTGDVISGSFQGNQTGQDVTGLINITASFDGTALTGPLSAYSYTDVGGQCSTCYGLGGATASFDPLSNNFVFANTNNVPIGGYTNYFYIIPWPNGAGNPVATQFYSAGNYVPSNQYNGDYIPGNWVLKAVPEPSTWAMMILGFCGLAFMAYRRKSKVFLAA
jgi:hypothetical protein